MPRLSVISHFYNNHSQVVAQIDRWSRIDPAAREQIEFILVDDCSDAMPAFDKQGLDLRLFRIDTDIDWNQAGARNLGALNASGLWGLFFDIDQVLDVSSIGTLLTGLDSLNNKASYCMKLKESLFNTVDNVSMDCHPATFLVRLREFRTMGMYDEDFAGHYGYEDIYLPRLWEANGGQRILLANPCFFDKQQDFGTTSLDRDLAHNLGIMKQKIIALQSRAPARPAKPSRLLRFDWHEVEPASSIAKA